MPDRPVGLPVGDGAAADYLQSAGGRRATLTPVTRPLTVLNEEPTISEWSAMPANYTSMSDDRSINPRRARQIAARLGA